MKWDAIDFENKQFTIKHTVVKIDKVMHKRTQPRIRVVVVVCHAQRYYQYAKADQSGSSTAQIVATKRLHRRGLCVHASKWNANVH